MKLKMALFVPFLISLPGCRAQKPAVPVDESSIINFSESVCIIRSLLCTNSLSTILEDIDPKKLDFLINNFSPAEIAFESEVLSCTLPVVIYCYRSLIDEQIITAIRSAYVDHKIVTINADDFPYVADSFAIKKYPALIFMKQREEVERVEGMHN